MHEPLNQPDQPKLLHTGRLLYSMYREPTTYLTTNYILTQALNLCLCQGSDGVLASLPGSFLEREGGEMRLSVYML